MGTADLHEAAGRDEYRQARATRYLYSPSDRFFDGPQQSFFQLSKVQLSRLRLQGHQVQAGRQCVLMVAKNVPKSTTSAIANHRSTEFLADCVGSREAG